VSKGRQHHKSLCECIAIVDHRDVHHDVVTDYAQVGYVVVNETAEHRAAGLHRLLRMPAASVRLICTLHRRLFRHAP